MVDAIRWLFTFSSPQHFRWFVISMAIFAGSLFCAAARKPWWPWGACCFHASTSVQAAVVLAFGYVGPVYSVHCIWFNALMAAVSIGLWRVAKRRKARPLAV